LISYSVSHNIFKRFIQETANNLKMVFTQAQLAQFFTAQDQMAIPEATRQQLTLEGITSVGDLSEFDKDGVKLCCIYQAVPTCQEWTRSLAGNGGAICWGGQVESRMATSR
jgi:hypothetical protein